MDDLHCLSFFHLVLCLLCHPLHFFVFLQILPIFNLYKSKNKNLGDGIDYGQKNYDCLGELVADTLSLFEQKGGDDAFINIKYMVPTYESSVNYA